MIDRISLKEAARKIGLSDTRSLECWCKRHGVSILLDTGCKSRYLIKSEFEDAADKSVLQQVSENKKVCTDEIQAKMNFTSEYLTAINNKKRIKGNKNDYQPKLGANGIAMMSRLQFIINNLE